MPVTVSLHLPVRRQALCRMPDVWAEDLTQTINTCMNPIILQDAFSANPQTALGRKLRRTLSLEEVLASQGE